MKFLKRWLQDSEAEISQTDGFTAQHARYFLVETFLSIVINVSVCAFYAWVPFQHLDDVPLWGLASISVDLIPTTLMAVTMVTFAVTGLTRIRMRIGAVPAVRWPREVHPVLGRLPFSVLRRSLLLGISLTLILVPSVVLVMHLGGITSLPFWTFFQAKVAYGATIGVVYTPFVLLVAFSDPIAKLRSGLWLWW